MPITIDYSRVTFAEPGMLWLLVVPVLLLVLWIRQLVKRQLDLRQLAQERTLPVKERYSLLGDLPFWLSLIVASSLWIVALARPHGPATSVRKGGIDLVVLQDGSASMRVRSSG